MQTSSVEAVIRALNQAGARYLVAGGLAVVAHGHVRLTLDVDLVIQLERQNVLKALRALEAIGYKPALPGVRIDDLADSAKRHEWATEKNAKVLQLYSDRHRLTPIDIFIDEPFDFATAAGRAHYDRLGGEETPFVSLTDLIEMKRAAGRPQDLLDVAELERIQRDRDLS